LETISVKLLQAVNEMYGKKGVEKEEFAGGARS
jgi:hypothetical protein